MRNKVPVQSRDISGCAALANSGGSPGAERTLHSLWRLKLSATRWWPAIILRGNCAFDWLNERQFPSLHYRSFVAVLSPLSNSPKAVFQPSALTDTDRLRGPQVNYINAAVWGCSSLFMHVALNCSNAGLTLTLGMNVRIAHCVHFITISLTLLQ